jgi:hypothetical protein
MSLIDCDYQREIKIEQRRRQVCDTHVDYISTRKRCTGQLKGESVTRWILFEGLNI